jgi:putative FmdB family regulatory protein
MPMYEYECGACHRRTEKIQKFSDPELTVCPHCGGPLERTITAPAFQFAGGGWYKDGYGNAKPAATGGEGAAKTEGASKTGGEGSAAAAPAATESSTAPAAATAPAPAAKPTASGS